MIRPVDEWILHLHCTLGQNGLSDAQPGPVVCL